jgi:hypothetical protein
VVLIKVVVNIHATGCKTQQLSRWNAFRANWNIPENLPHCRLVHHESHMTWPVLEPGPPQWEAGDYPPMQLNGQTWYLLTPLLKYYFEQNVRYLLLQKNNVRNYNFYIRKELPDIACVILIRVWFSVMFLLMFRCSHNIDSSKTRRYCVRGAPVKRNY